MMSIKVDSAVFLGATAAALAFGQPTISGALIVVDWASDMPMIEYSCIKAKRLHSYQFQLGKPEWACMCGA